jgi:biotin carboxyl carrier protein
MKYKIAVGEKKFEVEIREVKDGAAQVTVDNSPYDITIENYSEMMGEITGGHETRLTRNPASARSLSPIPALSSAASIAAKASAPTVGDKFVTAPIPGLILEIMVKVGDTVSSGQVVAIMEAMKMENNLTCDVSGTVQEIWVQKGGQVATGDVIVVIG